MALWYDCGNGWLKTRGLARCDLGADAYLVCPGPSLAAVDASALNGPGRMIFAITTAYPTVRPDVWIGTDVPECYDRRLWAEPFVKVVRGSHRDMSCEGRPLRQFPNVFFADLENAPVCEIFQRRGHDTVFIWNQNTFTTALHLMVWMGARRILLVGCDFGGARDYHDGRRLSAPRRDGNRRLYANLVKDLQRLAPLAKTHGSEIISCTPGSPVNEFLPFLDLACALEASESQAPDRRAPVLHAADAELCHWRTRILHDRGVVVGLDAGSEWLAAWWFGCLREHSDLPVAFADFGMTDPVRRWCAARGEVVDVRDIAVGKPSLRKPFAILRAPFREVLFLEPVCEVRGALDPVFRYCCEKSPGFAPAASGDHAPQCRRNDSPGVSSAENGAWDTAAVAVQHGHPLVTDWAAETLARAGRYESDIEPLARVIVRLGCGIDSMPPQLVSKPDGPHGGAAIVHWAGAEGTAALKDLVKAGPRAEPLLEAAGPSIGWNTEPADTLGVVVPVCASQRDLLPWWWWAYSRRNQRPVAFTDFGMDDDTRRWCETRGRVIAPEEPAGVEGWFRKPFAILRSPFRQTVWADLDCEIREDIFVLAAFADGRLAIGRDWSYPAILAKRLPFKGPCWSSALAVFTHGDPLVVEWARKVVQSRQQFRGDQEVLSAILNDGRQGSFAEFPVDLIRSRQEGEDEALAAVHWSGPGGKGAVRRAWAAIRGGLASDMRSAFWYDWVEGTPSADRGVVVGLDEAQEWLLDWWWSNYSSHNDLPVHFVDFGMTGRARAWCAARGTLSAPVPLDCYGWFKKPLACLKSFFRQALWLDTDCEVRGPLDALFDFCADGGIGLTLDRGTPLQYREAMPHDAPIYNTGVVAFNHGDPVVPQWASMTLALRSDRPGDTRYGQPGDQETLALALRRYACGRVRPIPKDLVRLRLSDGDGPALVMHWTGPVGKQHIRSVMNPGPAEKAAVAS